jgi:hypothetical protein
MRSILKYNWIFFLFLIFSCNSERTDEISSLKDEVIGIHDEVMPLMGELKSLKKEIEVKSKDLYEEDSTLNQGKIEELNFMATELQSAFDGMFVWMRQYKSPEEDMDKEEAKIYLMEQKQKVELVNKDIKTALASAKQELGKD